MPETSFLRVFAPLPTTTLFIINKIVLVGPLGAEEAVPFLWEELGKFGECGRGERQKKEMGACPAKTRSSKKEQKATHQTSESWNHRGRILLPFRAYSGWKHWPVCRNEVDRTDKKPVVFLLLRVVFRGHKGKRHVCLGFVWVF